MKKLSSILGVAGVLALGAVAQAQAPGDPGAPPAMAPPPGDTGVTVTTETTTGVGGADMTIGAEDPGTLPTTGGAPIAMALVGTLTAAGAFFARRKLS